jgi:hypothetical protein
MIELAITIVDAIEAAVAPHADLVAVAGLALVMILARRGTARVRARTLD